MRKDFVSLSVESLAVFCQIIETIRPGKIDSTDIAAALGIRKNRFLERYLQQIRIAGLVHSVRGPDGGYWLTNVGRHADVLTIVERLYGPQTSPLVTAWRGIMPGDLVADPALEDAA